MEEGSNRGDLLGNIARPSSLRTSVSLKSTLSGRSTPRGSPSFRGLNSSRTPQREGRTGGSIARWLRGNRVLFLLLLITLWTYAGFSVQSWWAHGDNKETFLGYESKSNDGNSDSKENHRRELSSNQNSLAVERGNHILDKSQPTLKDRDVVLAKKGHAVPSGRTPPLKDIDVVFAKKVNTVPSGQTPPLKDIDVVLAKKTNVVPSGQTLKRKSKRSKRDSHKKRSGKKKAAVEYEATEIEEPEPDIPKRNTSYGLIVGPFGSTEDRILEWSPEKRLGTCDKKGEFARLVWSRKFLLIFHELSMTGAPLSMMELATELLSCGATVSVVVLSKKGGLMTELLRRKIKILDDRASLSFKTAMKADLVIAGSAVCSSWIEQYLAYFPGGSSHIAWWIMENRREYFDRSKFVLKRVKVLIFLAESHSKQWLAWCAEENIKLNSHLAVVPLSVNDELAFVAGIACSLNSPSPGPEKMLEKRKLLRNAIREEMGLKHNDMLVMSLSSINAGKGQLLLLESAHIVFEKELSHEANIRTVVSETEGIQEQNLKVLVGSVGSKSNKIPYVKAMLSFVSQHSNLSKSVLWTPATTRVASLYSAADVYVINSQGLGETFGRVTIEAMAFGLPVLGTNAGGTKDIVHHNETGLLHPVGHTGAQLLSENLQILLKNPLQRQKMGSRGREDVEKMYLKRHMYKKLAEVLFRCMRRIK